jgi:hypothetical protein
MFMTEIARQTGNSAIVSPPPGLDAGNIENIRRIHANGIIHDNIDNRTGEVSGQTNRSWGHIFGNSSFELGGIPDSATNRRFFIYGIAMHAATDVYAHCAWTAPIPGAPMLGPTQTSGPTQAYRLVHNNNPPVDAEVNAGMWHHTGNENSSVASKRWDAATSTVSYIAAMIAHSIPPSPDIFDAVYLMHIPPFHPGPFTYMTPTFKLTKLHTYAKEINPNYHRLSEFRYLSIVDPPEITRNGNQVTMTTMPGGEIYYTTNGARPRLGAGSCPHTIRYTGPVSIPQNTVIKAISNISHIPSRNVANTIALGAYDEVATRFDGLFSFRNVNSQRFMDVASHSHDTRVDQWGNQVPGPQWRIIRENSGYYRIASSNNQNLVLEAVGSNLWLRHYTGSTAQQWRIIENLAGATPALPAPTPTYRLEPRSAPGQVVGIDGNSTLNGAFTVIHFWDGYNNSHKWLIS